MDQTFLTINGVACVLSARRNDRKSPVEERRTSERRQSERRKTGRPSKGPRDEVTVRLPVELAAAVRKLAKQRSMSINDLIGELMAEQTGVPYQDQEALKLSA